MKGLIAYIHTEKERENKNERADYNIQIIYLIYNHICISKLYMYIKLNI